MAEEEKEADTVTTGLPPVGREGAGPPLIQRISL